MRLTGLTPTTRILRGTYAALLILALAPTAAAARPQQVRVMSYNIFQGTELSHVITAQSASQLPAAVAADYNNVLASNIPTRAKAIAAEIKTAKPDLVGLQEAVLWRTQKPAGATPHATHVAFDFVKLLVSALSKEGLHYRAAAITNNLDFQLPGSFPGGSMDIRYTDRVAIIVRRGVKVSNVQQKNFVAHSSVPLVGTSVPVPDGFASVDAKLGTKRFRFVTSHLVGTPDPNAPSIRAAEANELINGPFKTTLPVIFTCDCNSKVGTATHSVLTGAGLKDIWPTVHANLAGLTCCHQHPGDLETDVRDPIPTQGIVQRIDYVFSSSKFKPVAESVVGSNKRDRRGGLWPSDHLGLAALLSLK